MHKRINNGAKWEALTANLQYREQIVRRVQKEQLVIQSHHSKQTEKVWLGARRSPERPVRSEPEALQISQELGKGCSAQSMRGQPPGPGIKQPWRWEGRPPAPGDAVSCKLRHLEESFRNSRKRVSGSTCWKMRNEAWNRIPSSERENTHTAKPPNICSRCSRRPQWHLSVSTLQNASKWSSD